jgi:nucleotide-binding universal stress UspA family protein
MPPTLRWALSRLPMEEDERKRLTREQADAQGFLAGFERALVVADDSAKGQFAARIAGLIARPRGTPVTILKADPPGNSGGSPPRKAIVKSSSAAEIVKAAAAIPPVENESAKPIDVVERRHDLPWHEAVSAEARKGYDLLVVGVDPTVGPAGGFHDHVSRLARSFPGSVAIISARGRHEVDPATAGFNILVPVTGSEVSRRGAEVALALGKAANTSVTALTVIAPESRNARQRFGVRIRDASEIAKEINGLAAAIEQPVKIARRTDISPEDAILREARLGDHDLILLGVSRRPGERLSFGDLAAALLESSDRSLFFLAPQASGTRAVV